MKPAVQFRSCRKRATWDGITWACCLLASVFLAGSARATSLKIDVVWTHGVGGQKQRNYWVTPQYEFRGSVPDGVYGFTLAHTPNGSVTSSHTVEIRNNRVVVNSPMTTLQRDRFGWPPSGGNGWTHTQMATGELKRNGVPLLESHASSEELFFYPSQRTVSFAEYNAYDDTPLEVTWKIKLSATVECDSCSSCVSGVEETGQGRIGPTSPGWAPAVGSGGSGSSGGGGNGGTGSGLGVPIGLGKIRHGEPAGSISFQADSLQSGVLDRAKLFLSANTGVEVIRISGQIRQTLSSTLLTEVNVPSSGSLEFKQYLASDRGTKNGSGLYQPIAPPLERVLLEHPLENGQLQFAKVRVTRTRGETSVTDYQYNAVTQEWSSVEGDGDNETVTKTWSPDKLERSELYLVRNAANTAVHEELNVYRAFPWGEERIRRVLGPSLPPDQQQISTWEFFTDSAQTGSFSRLRNSVGPGGFWERLEYDGEGRVTRRVSQFLDAAQNAPESECRVVATTYSDVNPRVTIVETLRGTEIRRDYEAVYSDRVDRIQAHVVGAAWNDSANLITTTYLVPTGTFYGQPDRILKPDGTGEIFSYVEANGERTTTISMGELNGTGNAVVDGTRRITRTNAAGYSLLEAEEDIASGLRTSARTTTAVDGAGRPLSVQHPDGSTETFTYDCCGVSSSSDRDGVATTFVYDEEARVISETRAGVTLLYEYDPLGRRIAVRRQGSDGTIMLLEESAYDLAGRMISSTSPRGLTSMSYGFDAAGHPTVLTSIPDGGDKLETFAKDGAPLVLTGTGVLPRKWEYGIEGGEFFAREIYLGSAGEETEWMATYTDFLGREYKMVYPDGAATLRFFNAKSQLVREVDPDGVTQLFSYNDEGEVELRALDLNQNGVIDLAEDRISRVTDSAANVAANVVSRTVYDVWNPSGPLTFLTEETNAAATERRSDRQGLVTHHLTTRGPGTVRTDKTTNPDGSYSLRRFEQGRLQEISRHDAAGTELLRKAFAYDAHGRMIEEMDARNGATSYIYDEADQVISITAPAAEDAAPPQVTLFRYDAQNRVIETTLPDGSATFSEYYPTGHLKKRHGAQVYPVDYTYDAQGRLKTLAAGTGVTTWNYDPQRGWLTSKVYDDGHGPSYTYSSAGRVRTRTWARGVVTEYSYDTAGELVGIDYSDATPDVTFDLDRRGRVIGVSDAAGDHVFAFNSFDQITSETITGGILDGVMLANEYDAQQRRNKLKAYRHGELLLEHTYSYDSASRLISVGNGTVSADYTYHPHSDLVASTVFQNAGTTTMQTTKTYDRLNRLTMIASSRPTGEVLSSHSYQYNSLDQRTRADLADGSHWLYQYDPLGQLTVGNKHWPDGTPVGGAQFTYEYDNIGNRTRTITNGRTANYTANSLNQYVSRTVPGVLDITGTAAPDATVTVNGNPATRKGDYFHAQVEADNSAGGAFHPVEIVAVKNNAGPSGEDAVTTTNGQIFLPPATETFAYDLDGNLIQDGRWTYEWDGENRLKSANQRVSRDCVSFLFDAHGRKIMNDAAEPVFFIYDGWQVLVEHKAYSMLSTSIVGRSSTKVR